MLFIIAFIMLLLMIFFKKCFDVVIIFWNYTLLLVSGIKFSYDMFLICNDYLFYLKIISLL